MTGGKESTAPGERLFAWGGEAGVPRDCSKCWGKPLGEAISCGDHFCPALKKGLLLLPFYWQEVPQDGI